MARRKSKARQREEFVRAVLSTISIVVFFVIYALTQSFGLSLLLSLVGVILVIVLMINLHIKKIGRLKRSGIAEIDQMEGVQFEKFLGYLFHSRGFKAEVTKATGDYGADLILSKDGKKIVVQAKRYSKNVGLKAVQEAHGAKAHYKASEAWVVTNSNFTQQAYNLANSNGVRLISRDELIEMLVQLKNELSLSKKAHNEKTSA